SLGLRTAAWVRGVAVGRLQAFPSRLAAHLDRREPASRTALPALKQAVVERLGWWHGHVHLTRRGRAREAVGSTRRELQVAVLDLVCAQLEDLVGAKLGHAGVVAREQSNRR